MQPNESHDDEYYYNHYHGSEAKITKLCCQQQNVKLSLRIISSPERGEKGNIVPLSPSSTHTYLRYVRTRLSKLDTGGSERASSVLLSVQVSLVWTA